MPTVRRSPARPLVVQAGAGLVGVLVLLTALTFTVGLGRSGWLVGVGYGIALAGTLVRAVWRSGRERLGPADAVTLTRAVLVGGVTALVAESFSGPVPVPVMVALATVALALDAVDGRVARRTGTVTAVGARFDMEVDAFLVLVLSVHVAVLVTPWALVIGGMRYVFVAVSWVLPWLSGNLPTRYSAKVVAAAQGIVLVVASAQLFAQQIAATLVVAALAALLWSFAKSATWLWRARPAHAAVTRRVGWASVR
jgi:phosphatidylglycerophosphate synthase